jgi:hypothetical protein
MDLRPPALAVLAAPTAHYLRAFQTVLAVRVGRGAVLAAQMALRSSTARAGQMVHPHTVPATVVLASAALAVPMDLPVRPMGHRVRTVVRVAAKIASSDVCRR